MKVLTFTSSRADSGILMPVLRELDSRPEISSVVCISGSHLDPSFGKTFEKEFSELERSQKVLIPLPPIDETFESQVKALGYGLSEFASHLRELAPDFALVLGDRTEALVFSVASTLAGIPLAHIHGGERTYGALDELHRHAITKMSNLHFTSNAENAKRVLQMGENSVRVFSFGSPREDTFREFRPLPLAACAAELGLDNLPSRFVLFAVHPAKFDSPSTAQIAREALKAIREEGFFVVFTGTNSDEGYDSIRGVQDEFMAENPDSFVYLESAGSNLYLSLLKRCNIAVGNSSSFALEAPMLGTPTVILGRRQLGRVAESDCILGDHVEIRKALRLAEIAPREQASSPNGTRVSQQIVDELLKFQGLSSEKEFQTIEY